MLWFAFVFWNKRKKCDWKALNTDTLTLIRTYRYTHATTSCMAFYWHSHTHCMNAHHFIVKIYLMNFPYCWNETINYIHETNSVQWIELNRGCTSFSISYQKIEIRYPCVLLMSLYILWQILQMKYNFNTFIYETQIWICSHVCVSLSIHLYL